VSVKSWDASVVNTGGSQPLRRPRSARPPSPPPPPPLRPDNYYDDACAVAAEPAEVADEEEDYLKPDENAAYLYAADREGVNAGNIGSYLELIDSYHEYSNYQPPHPPPV